MKGGGLKVVACDGEACDAHLCRNGTREGGGSLLLWLAGSGTSAAFASLPGTLPNVPTTARPPPLRQQPYAC